MFDKIFTADASLFFLINSGLTSPFLDMLMPWLRNKFIWAPLYMFVIAFFIINYKKQGIIALLYLAIIIVLCDQFSSSFFKPLFQRVRPCNDVIFQDHIRLLINCGSGFSFPSSHAANHFGAAVFLGIFFMKHRIVFPLALFWAALVGYAQVYVGVHYPFDVFAGAALGCLVGSAFGLLCMQHLKKIS